MKHTKSEKIQNATISIFLPVDILILEISFARTFFYFKEWDPLENVFYGG